MNEECDDGNIEDGDGCSANCTIEGANVCGDANVDMNEECDDGNNETVTVVLRTARLKVQRCLRRCKCRYERRVDDGNTEDGDGCSANCTVEASDEELCEDVLWSGWGRLFKRWRM